MTLSDGSTLEISAGALNEPVSIEMTRTGHRCVADHVLLTPVYDFGPDGLSFAQPIRVVLPFAGDADSVTVYWSNDAGGYEALETQTWSNSSGNWAAADVSHFSTGFVAEADADEAVDAGTEPTPVADAGSTDDCLLYTSDAADE